MPAAQEVRHESARPSTTDLIRMPAPVPDMPAAYAAADIVVSAAVQPEGVQRALLEAQTMARPLIVSDFDAGTDVVLTAPVVDDGRGVA
jgi:glycosyltransferase involved in cell wall biosynthesis